MFAGGSIKTAKFNLGKKGTILIVFFKALGDTNRHRIFSLVDTKKRLSAGDIAKKLRISRPLASQHLKILVASQLFIVEKIGQHKFYQINKKNPSVRDFILAVKKLD
jgi:DNA-binding transcriptional ArsR family regulator